MRTGLGRFQTRPSLARDQSQLTQIENWQGNRVARRTRRKPEQVLDGANLRGGEMLQKIRQVQKKIEGDPSACLRSVDSMAERRLRVTEAMPRGRTEFGPC